MGVSREPIAQGGDCFYMPPRASQCGSLDKTRRAEGGSIFPVESSMEEFIRFATNGLKTCRSCLEVKPVSEFSKEKRRKDGLCTICKECSTRRVTEWRGRNKEHWREYNREYQRSNPEKVKLWQSRSPRGKFRRKERLNRERRALFLAKQLASAEFHFTFEEWLAKCREFDFRCVCCGEKLEFGDITDDHIRPLCKGGTNHISNIQPMCLDCNKEKRTKIIDYTITFFERFASQT